MWANLSTRGKTYAYVVIALVLCIARYFAYQYFHPAQLVTGESQQQAETPVGISLAAHNADVGLMQDQLDQASREIARLKGLPPDVVIKTVPYEVEKTVTQYVKSSGADFAIITDPKNPDKVVDLKEVAKLPATTPVTINAYNVFAYKKAIRDVTIYPSFNGITPSGVNEVAYSVNRKITNDGKYIGLSVAYDVPDKKTMVGLKYIY